MVKQNNTSGDAPVVVERVLHAPVAAVWKALTEREQMKQWSFDVKDFKPQAGYEFRFDGQKDGVTYIHRCKVTEAVPQKKLAYSWRYEGYEGNSLVTIDLVPQGDKTKIHLTHTGLESFHPEKYPDFAKENFQQGWRGIFDQLEAFLTTAAAA